MEVRVRRIGQIARTTGKLQQGAAIDLLGHRCSSFSRLGAGQSTPRFGYDEKTHPQEMADVDHRVRIA
ncbi:hypothetical protein GCM10010981_07350 [Dyella nitratireducens]|uniref:Uncharacterized protein n=1 Tax=Dyella nitratireducens TaxID=1849580 RepID=A0ABQ1FLR8_9GAMM|nr:hypothetical protein GCM10010981_07350 [Dyella nitratireducens]